MSSLDMDPGQTPNVGSPGGSRITLLSGVGGDGILSALASPQPGTPTQIDTSRVEPLSKFTDLRRLVSFAVRRDTVM